MPVLAKFSGIVIRLMVGSTIGTRVHAFHGNEELVLGLNPLRIIQSEVPPWVEARVLEWVREHERQIVSPWWPTATQANAAWLPTTHGTFAR